MFDRFTEPARKVMGLARQEAQRLQHDYIGAEHILLALPDAGGSGASVLSALGITRERLRAAVEDGIVPGTLRTLPSMLPFTSESKKILESAMEAAQAAKSANLKSKDLLLGVIGVANATSPAGRALTTLGLTDVSAVRGAVLQLPRAELEERGA